MYAGYYEERVSADDVRAENHSCCERPECRADVCCANARDGVGRENCPCDGDAPDAVLDGVDPGLTYCSLGCLILSLAAMAEEWGCGAFFVGSTVTDGAAVAS